MLDIIWNKCECHQTQYQLHDLYGISCIVLTCKYLAIVKHAQHSRAWLYQRVQKLVLKCGSNIQIKVILSQKYCMNEIRVIGTFLESGSLDPNIWVLLPFLDPNIRTLLWWKYIKDVVIMWLVWQTWLTQPGKFNLQLQSPSWNYDPNIRMRMDPKKMVQHQVYTSHFDVTYQGQKVVQVDLHFGVQRLIQYFWIHYQVQTQIFGSNMNLNPLIQSCPYDPSLNRLWCINSDV